MCFRTELDADTTAKNTVLTALIHRSSLGNMLHAA